VAKRNIVCYKYFVVTHGGFRSPYTKKFWGSEIFSIGACLKPDSFDQMPDKNGEITNGIHSYRKLQFGWLGWLYRAEPNGVLITCWIPKGARYWIGKDNDYCSDRLCVRT
jgi:hypothetical protein